MAKTLIKTVTVGAGGAMSLDISNIPSTFTDLEITLSARGGAQNVSTATDILQMRFNGSTTGYSYRSLWQLTGTIYTTTNSSNALPTSGGDTTAGTFGSSTIYIPNYAGSNNKAWSVDSAAEQNSTTGVWLNITSGLWANTSAITSISFVSLNDFALQPGTTASLYGVTKAGTPVAKATGGTITFDVGYTYHTFTSSGTFTPTTALTADILVVAGGGGGGRGVGGGGGAGGLLGFTNQSLTATGYAVAIGAGGAGSSSTYGSNGANSTFGALTATIGGGGGGTNNLGSAEQYGRAGGSGGGSYGTGYAGGAGTAGQGNAGGSPTNVGYGAGGGGAGAAASTTGSGSGGIGVNTYASWASATGTGDQGYFAGGGAGGYGGAGALGGGGTNSDGMANTGGGGYGGKTGNGYNGGSGIVIVRYAN